MALFPASSMGSDDFKLGYIDINATSGAAYYNFSGDKPSDYDLPLCAQSVGGTRAIVAQISGTILFFSDTLAADSSIRILYKKKNT